MKRSTLWVLIGFGALALMGGGAVIYNATRGLRNNNPGNIRRSNTAWQGLSPNQTDPDFLSFISPVYGIRAMAKILTSYANRGVTTLQDIIMRWAPPEENNTAAYIQDVSARMGIAPQADVDISMWPALIAAIIHHENGVQPYDSQTLHQGVDLALNG